MVSKCKGIAEVAVMEMAQVGPRTRGREALPVGAAATLAKRSPKRRKINREELQVSASSYGQLKGTSRAAIQQEADERCSSPTSDESPSSCCSSNGSIRLDEDRIKFIDLEVESPQVETSTCNCGDERREMSPSSELQTNSDDLKPMESNSSRTSMVQNMPTELELEEFFAAAEKDIQKCFAKKYNYDTVKDVPLEGRYEWVQIKP